MSAPGQSGLRLMHVHAHPDDESSKGAATTAKYVAEGVDVHVVTCTGGERGSVLNPKMDRPDVLANITEIRREEMERAREILGVTQDWLGFVDSGWPEGDPLPPLPEGCFGLVPLEEAAEPLVRLIRSFRPHVITTYDEKGGYPHPDHINCHEISVEAFEAAADPKRYPGAGEPWEVLKLYYQHGFNRPKAVAMHEAAPARARVALRRAPRGVEARPGLGRSHHHAGAVRGVLPGPRPGTASRTPPRSTRTVLVPRAAGGPAVGLADRGLRARDVAVQPELPEDDLFAGIRAPATLDS